MGDYFEMRGGDTDYDEVLLINPSANVFFFGELWSIIRTG